MLVIVAKLQAPFTSAHIITTSSWRHQNKNPATASESRDHIAGDIPRVGARRNRETCSSSPRHASSSRRLRPGRSSHRGGAGVQPSGPHRSSRRRRLSRSRLPRPGSTCSQSTAQQPASTSARRSSNHHPIHIAMVPYKSTPDEVEVELAMKTGGRWPAARSTLHVEARLLNRRRRRCHEVIEAQPDGAGAAHLSPAAAPTSMLKPMPRTPSRRHHGRKRRQADAAAAKTPRHETPPKWQPML